MKLSKKSLLGTLTLSALVLGAYAPTALAADEPVEVTAKSDAKVTFKEDDGETTPPVNPGEPDPDPNPGEPDPEPGGGGSKGPLRVDYVSNLRFGEQKISGSSKEYHPTLVKWNFEDATSIYIPHFIQVTDNRGSNEGWTLSVERSEFATTENEVLTGAELVITNGEVVSISDMPAETTPGVVQQTVTIPVGSAATVMTAAENQGMATWSYSFGQPISNDAASTDPTAVNNDVTLKVPGTAKKIADKEYTSNITWTLAAAEV
ncbi:MULTISPECIES: WxL domain-containing protein [unclassified Enterococcus]|uniref:WxL domain-containing protein n=1 Tax=unclassified Enterococcus TaxID=2608891 RepID=UPI001CE0D062|nr:MULTISPECIES: WxL domain-containing protein [unclassified Enterococcus]MCA5013468.1 WxL domain-containing protein [Enterococcus sp. S23]MCA5016718.1 WxL domain-containing protein [Enterococcus sp. S22(2020)]